MSKVTVLGTGMVGATFAYRLLESGLASEMLLVDVDKRRAEGEMMDLQHAMSFHSPCTIRVGDYQQIAGSDVVVISAGVAQKPGESRLELVKRNVAIFKQMIPQVVQATHDAILVIATNPVDVMTEAAIRYSGFDPSRVIGSGTVLDTARFRYLLGQYYDVDPRSVHAYIIGEHGDSEVPVFSTASIAGVSLHEIARQQNRPYNQADLDNIFQQVRQSAYHIIERKGATYYSIASGLLRIVEAVLRDQNTVFAVSNLLTGQYGVEDVCLSLPAVVNSKGIRTTLTLPLNQSEEEAFVRSASIIKSLSEQSL